MSIMIPSSSRLRSCHALISDRSSALQIRGREDVVRFIGNDEMDNHSDRLVTPIETGRSFSTRVGWLCSSESVHQASQRDAYA